MMRRVPATAPIHWLIDAAKLCLRHPRAILLGTLNAVMVFLATILFIGIALGALLRLLGFNQTDSQSGTALLAITIPLMAITMLVPQLLIAGIAHLVQRADTTGTPHPIDAFASLRRENFFRLSPLVLIPTLNLVAGIALYALFGGEHFFADYMHYLSALQTAAGKPPAPPAPASPVALFFTSFALSAFVYLLQLFAPIHAMLGRRSGLSAIVECLRSFAANAPAMLLGGVLGMMLIFGFAIAFFLALAVSAAIAQAAPMVGSLLALAVSLLLLSACASFWIACGYYGWRDVFGTDQAAPPPAAPDHVAM